MKLLRCKICGKIIEVIHDTPVDTVCCEKEMVEIRANDTDGALEKHVPHVTIENDQLLVKIGEIEHPSVKEHYIMFITVVFGNSIYRTNIKPEEKPAATFNLNGYHGEVKVYEYCNLHGLWVKEIHV